MVDRLPSLRHDAVVRGDDHDGDVCYLRAASAHLRERLVARSVDEADRAAVWGRRLVGADVLSDAAGFALDDGRLADAVQQRRLPVVDVSEDRHHGRSIDLVVPLIQDAHRGGFGRWRFGVVRLIVGLTLLGGCKSEVGGDDSGGVEVDHLRDGGHHAVLHQLLDHVDRGDGEQLCEVAHDDRGRDLDRDLGRSLDRDLRLRFVRDDWFLCHPDPFSAASASGADAAVAASCAAWTLRVPRSLSLSRVRNACAMPPSSAAVQHASRGCT